jgi:hypothetical protein
MKPASDHSAAVIFNNALRIAVGDLADIHPRIQNQLLEDCMLDDMTDLDFRNQAVSDFINMFTGNKHSDMTVGSLRSLVAEVFSGCSASHVASRWTSNSDERGLRALSQRCSRNESLIDLNQLLVYIGGRNLNESYKISRKSPPVYQKNSEYNNVSYSLGLGITYDSPDEYESYTEISEYKSKNLLQLLDESRYVIEHILIGLIETSDVASAHIKIDDIHVYMNDVKVLEFPINELVEDMYHNDLSLQPKLFEAKSLTGVENFAEILLSGNLFRSRECYIFKQFLKGKALEYELGM